jgi:hypothetical protein
MRQINYKNIFFIDVALLQRISYLRNISTKFDYLENENENEEQILNRQRRQKMRFGMNKIFLFTETVFIS